MNTEKKKRINFWWLMLVPFSTISVYEIARQKYAVEDKIWLITLKQFFLVCVGFEIVRFGMVFLTMFAVWVTVIR